MCSLVTAEADWTRTRYAVAVGKSGAALVARKTTRVRVGPMGPVVWELEEKGEGRVEVFLLIQGEGFESQGYLEHTVSMRLCAGSIGVPAELEPFARDLGWVSPCDE
jgi:hypothetical protein